MMHFVAVLFLFGILMIGMGLVLAIFTLVLLILCGLVSSGILSTSILVALNKKSLGKGFKTFILITSSIVGFLIGLVSFGLQNSIQHWWSTKFALISGATCGLITGLLFGLLTNFILRKLTNYFRFKLKI